jgi:phosphoribosylanthranilate isomerase
MFIKICGITDEAGLLAASRADAVGFVFAPSPRRITPAAAASLAARLPSGVRTVAVLSHARQSDIDAVCAVFRPDLVQTEVTDDLSLPDGVSLLPVFHDRDTVLDELTVLSHPGEMVILEGAAVGGQGIVGNLARAAQASAMQQRLILAGGLSPANVADIITTVRPWGVDVSSGVESRRGVKDPQLIHQFIDAAKSAARSVR